MTQLDNIIINSTQVSIHILSFYDGTKEAVDIENNTIFLWYDTREDCELWLIIKPHSSNTLLSYLRNEIGIMDMIKSSSINLYKRLFKNNYDEFEVFDGYEEIEYPENVTLGMDFLKIIEESNVRNPNQ